jgi:hypothetical protein
MCDRGNAGDAMLVASQAYERNKARPANQSAAYERIKSEHHAIMGRISALRKAWAMPLQWLVR